MLMNKKNRKLKNKSGPSMAENADRHVLYEESVQNVEFEVEFVADTYRSIRNKEARFIREDFCGSASAACAWIKQHNDNAAIGVDLDGDVLAWGRAHHLDKLKPQQAARISLIQQDVLQVETELVDCILAMNFSYWFFKTRTQLRSYFEKVHRDLCEEGVFFMDAYGGYEAYEVLEEETEYDRFTYIWDQAYYNPVNGDIRCHIHFSFPDGSKLKKAFTYEWRLWSLPELRELLEEAGFKKSTVYMQGWDEKNEEETDEFYPTEVADADAGWVAYIVAEK